MEQQQANREMELTRDLILEADDLPTKEIDIPEWGGKAHIRIMTGAERDRFEMEASKLQQGIAPKVSFRARFAATILCDKDGKRIFDDRDIAALSRKSGAVLDRVLAEGMEHNKVREEDVEELAKNS